MIFQESTVKYHVVGLKCLNCGSYNTCRVKGSPSPGKILNLLLLYDGKKKRTEKKNSEINSFEIIM